MEQAPILPQLLPLFVLGGLLAYACFRLAEEKQRNAPLWALLGFIPFVNLFAIVYIVGATNLEVERKLDRVLEILEKEKIPLD